MDAQSISLVITSSASAAVAVLAALRLSRCTRIKCCCFEVDRDGSHSTRAEEEQDVQQTHHQA